MAKKKKTQFRRTCIFCGEAKVSEEHIWPNWLKSYLPMDIPNNGHIGSFKYFTIDPERGRTPLRHQFKTEDRPGDPRSRKLRVACENCNNGWMSRIVNDAKETIVPHLEGDWRPKKNSEFGKLAKWMTLFTMVFEQKHPETSAITAEQRQQFMLNLEIPKNWNIWIGQYQGALWKGVTNHFGLDAVPIQVASEQDFFERINKGGMCRTQTTAICLGNLFIMSFFSDVPERYVQQKRSLKIEYGVRQIYPFQRSAHLSPRFTLNDFDADQASRHFVPDEMKSDVRPAWQSRRFKNGI